MGAFGKMPLASVEEMTPKDIRGQADRSHARQASVGREPIGIMGEPWNRSAPPGFRRYSECTERRFPVRRQTHGRHMHLSEVMCILIGSARTG